MVNRINRQGSSADLESICSEVGVFEELPEALHVALPAHVGQVRHHVGNDLEASILGQVEALPHCCHCMAPVCISSNILKDALQANL